MGMSNGGASRLPSLMPQPIERPFNPCISFDRQQHQFLPDCFSITSSSTSVITIFILLSETTMSLPYLYRLYSQTGYAPSKVV